MTTTLKVELGDVVRTSSGGFARVERGEKLRQGVRTLLGLESPTGAGIANAVAPDDNDAVFVSLALRRSVRGSLERYGSTLRSTQRAERSPEEMLDQIVACDVSVLSDPTAIGFKVTVQGGRVPVIVSGRRVFP